MVSVPRAAVSPALNFGPLSEDSCAEREGTIRRRRRRIPQAERALGRERIRLIKDSFGQNIAHRSG
jgi:hypothetical protein